MSVRTHSRLKVRASFAVLSAVALLSSGTVAFATELAADVDAGTIPEGETGSEQALAEPSSSGTEQDPTTATTFFEGAALGTPEDSGQTEQPSVSALSSCGMSASTLTSAAATYESLIARMDQHGLAPTSLTNTYPAGLMYMRDGAAQALAMIRAGDVEEAGALTRTLVTYPLAAGFTRDGAQTLPHRLPQITDTPLSDFQPDGRIAAVADEGGVLIEAIPTSELGELGSMTTLQVPLEGLGADEELKIRVAPLGLADAPHQVGSATTKRLSNGLVSADFLLSPPGYSTSQTPKTLLVAISKSAVSDTQVKESLSNYSDESSSRSVSAYSEQTEDPVSEVTGEAEAQADGASTESGALQDAPEVRDGSVENEEYGPSKEEVADSSAPSEPVSESAAEQTSATSSDSVSETGPSSDAGAEQQSGDSGEPTQSEQAGAPEEQVATPVPSQAQEEDQASSEGIGSSTLRTTPNVLQWAARKSSVGVAPAYSASGFDFSISDPLNGNDGSTGVHTWEETDEYYHVIYVWAAYVLAAGTEKGQPGAEFAAETWPTVAKYIDYHLERDSYWLGNTLPSSGATLLINPRLDASGYHDNVYDLITNVFVSQSYRTVGQLSKVVSAIPEQALSTGASWEELANSVDSGIRDNLIQDVDGSPVYIPWINGALEPETETSIWVSLSPIAIDWPGLHVATMRNTVDLYTKRNSFNFGGTTMLNARNGEGQSLNAGPNGTRIVSYTGQWVLLKSLLWEYKFEQQQGNRNRVAQLQKWIDVYFPKTNTPAPESWVLDNVSEIPVRDGGNQEHSAWFVTALLDLYPQCETAIQDAAHTYIPPEKLGQFTPIETFRNFGSTRIDTAASAAVEVYQENRPASVYLARADVYADALAAGSLTDGPILLTNPVGSLPQATKTALKALQPRRVVALGGTGVISNSVLNEAARQAGTTRTARLFGPDRFSTAANVALAAYAAEKSANPRKVVYLADGFGSDGLGSPDAVSASGLTDGYLLLVNSKSKTLHQDVKSALQKIKPTEVIALGGPLVVSDQLLAEAAKLSGHADTGRVFGADRYATSLAIYKRAAKYHAPEVVLARGDILVDAITAGGLNRGPVLITRGGADTTELVYQIQRTRPLRLRVLGGPTVIPTSLVDSLALKAVQPG